MADKETIQKVENILVNLEKQLGEHYNKNTLPKIVSTINLYNWLTVDMRGCVSGTEYPQDFYYHINNGMSGILNYYYSTYKRNLIYRDTDKISEKNRELCYDTIFDFAFTKECREYYLISDIEIQDKRIIIKPFTSNTLEVFDFYRDHQHYFDSGITDKNENIFSSIDSDRDKLFNALNDFYSVAIESAGIEFKANIGGIPYATYITALFFLITLIYEQSNWLIDNDFLYNCIKILDIRTLKNELLRYINSYQSRLLDSAKEISKSDIETIYKVISINFDNYNIALSKGHIDKMFIQLNDKYCTFITSYAPTEYLSAFSYLNKLLEAYFPNEYNKNRDSRENIMFDKLRNCLKNENLQLKQGIKLRNKERILTDIDAIIYDEKNNIVYFQQFKYQDDFIRDIKAKRNQTQRLEKQVSQWFDAINIWLSEYDIVKFLKDSHFYNVKENPKLKYIVFTQYNINQLIVKELKKDTIYVSDSMFYDAYSKIGDLQEVFKKIYKENRIIIEEPMHYNSVCHILDYEIYYDYNSEMLMEYENRWHKSQNDNAIRLY